MERLALAVGAVSLVTIGAWAEVIAWALIILIALAGAVFNRKGKP